MAMGRIQAKLEAEEAAKPSNRRRPAKGRGGPEDQPKKKNPKPMKSHIDGGAAPGVKDDDWWAEKASPEEYLAREMEKKKALGR